jgi:hypothetical protein
LRPARDESDSDTQFAIFAEFRRYLNFEKPRR